MPKTIACYIRLSQADDDLNQGTRELYESSSVSHQRELIHTYLKEHPEFDGWNIREFVDDGYSGTSDKRPEFQRMIELARRGQIHCIIVKDFSRFARNYIMMGDYLEQIFPFLGIRFISINDGYDSNLNVNVTDDMSVVLKSILNSYYSRDLSAKMFSFNTQRMQSGNHTGVPCFGYVMNEERTHFVVDPEAAKIVRQIFDLALQGTTRTEIARILNSQSLPTPAEYNRLHGYSRSQMTTTAPLWDHIKVSAILRNPHYTGKLVMRKLVHVAPCSKKRRRADPSEQIIRENAHEAIITQEEFDRVQELFPKKKGWDRKNQADYPLKRLVRCGTCKKVMCYYRRNQCFQCGESLLQGSQCSSQLYSMQEIETIVFRTLRSSLSRIIKEERQYRQFKSRSPQLIAKCQAETHSARQKQRKLLAQKTNLYEEYAAERITLDQYLKQKEKLNRQSTELEVQIQSLQEQESAIHYAAVPTDLQQAAYHANKYIHDKAFSKDAATAFIDAIYLMGDTMEVHWKFQSLMERLVPEDVRPIKIETTEERNTEHD